MCVFFTFLGEALPAPDVEQWIPDEEYLAHVAALQEADRQKRQKRKNETKTAKERRLREAAKAGDPEAIEAVKELNARANGKKRRKRQEKREADPDYELHAQERKKAATEKAMATKRAKMVGNSRSIFCERPRPAILKPWNRPRPSGLKKMPESLPRPGAEQQKIPNMPSSGKPNRKNPTDIMLSCGKRLMTS